MDSDKPKLREQAKSLLLKGCYKMAAIKYQRLIDLGSEGFTQRQWSVVYLNQGICYQFLEQHQKALDLANRSIDIDPTYEKAYYRRMQILRQMKSLEAAIKSIPSWIKNKQIEQMMNQVKEEYYGSLGLNDLMESMLSGKDVEVSTIKDSHTRFYQKLVEHLEAEDSKESWGQIGHKIANYYSILKEKKQEQILESFLHILHSLIVKTFGNDQEWQKAGIILKQFWQQFIKQGDPFSKQSYSEEDLLDKEEYKLAKYAPLCKQTLLLLQKMIQSQFLPLDTFFDSCLQMAGNMLHQQGNHQFGDIVHKCIVHIISLLEQAMEHSLLGWLKKSFLLTDTLIRLRLHFEPDLKFTYIKLQNLLYLRFSYLHQTHQNSPNPLFDVSQQKIKQFFEAKINSFVVMYTFEQFIHKLDRQMFKMSIQEIEEELDIMREVGGNKKNKQTDMQKQFELVYTSIMLKIDLRHATARINLPSLLSHKHNRQTIYDQSLSDLIINTLLLLAISNKRNLIEIFNHPHSITDIVHQFTTDKFTQQLQSIATATSFIYLIVVDIELEQQQIYAKRMGVTLEQIQKARKLQKESIDPLIKEESNRKRSQFIDYMIKHWNEIIVNMSIFLLKVKEEQCLTKWGKIMKELAKHDVSRFHHSKIIEVMLEAFKVEKAASGQFFSLLCKKMNTNLLKYEHIQAICNILIYNVENAEHQLIIFQSLLGLINMTSNNTNKIKIPIKPLQRCLFEDNQYIIHGALQLLNNVLIYESKKDIEQLKQLKDLLQKYFKYLREEITKEDQILLTDYSHPSRVYSTLISVAIVMDLDYLQEFQDWQTSQKYLKRIKPPRGITFFKMAMYMKMKKRLHGKWWQNFTRQLDELQQTNPGYWMKLKQYMN